MALLDHFHRPLSIRRHWHSFHSAWATYIADDLNHRLPEGYFAEPNVQFGIEIDVATFEEPPHVGMHDSSNGAGGGAPVLMASIGSWSPAVPVRTLPFQFATDTVEVSIYNSDAGPTLLGAIELVSPANKDRAAHRNTFVSKCETYLRQGIGLVVVDVVTERKANLHHELLKRLGSSVLQPLDAALYAVAYRPITRNGQESLDIWEEALAIGKSLPTMPLWLRDSLCFGLDLESTYLRTCRSQRISVGGS